MSWEVLQDDCVAAMRRMEDCSVDSVVADPPYGIGFMGHEWDQPGEYGPITANGEPADFASGRAAEGPHVVGGLGVAGREGQPPGQRRGRNPKPKGMDGGIGIGDQTGTTARTAAMHVGRYDLSRTANRRYQAWCEAWATEALRVLKPGGYLVAFGGTRTYHRLAAGIEDAGFEIRDQVAWLFGSGFPKSLDVAKAIDRARDVDVTADERHVQEDHPGRPGKRERQPEVPGAKIGQTHHVTEKNPDGRRYLYVPETEEAREREGWGTALKPGHEPIVVARKPLDQENVAANVLAHGTGAINVGGCAIEFASEEDERESKEKNRHGDFDSEARNTGAENRLYGEDHRTGEERGNYDPLGRWPPNVALDEEAAGLLDEQAGERPTGAVKPYRERHLNATSYRLDREKTFEKKADFGGASRFFYVAKASRGEREAGLRGAIPCRTCGQLDSVDHPAPENPDVRAPCVRNGHPTVKPIKFMRWLCRMHTPPGGKVVDLFAGSGTTGCAASLEGFDFVGIERDDEHGYVPLAEARLRYWSERPPDATVEEIVTSEARRTRAAASGQTELLA